MSLSEANYNKTRHYQKNKLLLQIVGTETNEMQSKRFKFWIKVRIHIKLKHYIFNKDQYKQIKEKGIITFVKNAVN